MIKDGVRLPPTIYPQISGFWTWDIKRNRVHGDANLFDYYGLDLNEFTTGASIERFMEGIVPEDRDRVSAAIQQSVIKKSGFRDIYRVKSVSRGVRRIMAVGRCYGDADGNPAQYPGWFMDISSAGKLRDNSLQVAAGYVEHARDLAGIAKEDFVSYLLDNVLAELEELLKLDGRRRQRRVGV